MTDQEIRDISKQIYDFLCEIRKEKPELTFRTRTKNDARKRKGYIFQGNSGYIAVPFYKGNSANNKTGCVLYVVKNDENYIELVADKNRIEDAEIIEEIAQRIDRAFEMKYEKIDNKHLLKYYYYFSKKNDIDNLKKFVSEIIPIIDIIVNDINNKSRIKKISTDEFEGKYRVYNFVNNNKSIFSDCLNLLEKNKNLVLTGAPGVGKTYLANNIAKALVGDGNEINNRIVKIQFHPSYDYTDFIEGLRPLKSKDGEDKSITFERLDGQLKEICKKAIQSSVTDEVDNFYDCMKLFLEDIQNNRESRFSVSTKGGKKWEFKTNMAGDGFVTTDSNTSYISINFEQLYNVYKGFPGVPMGGNDYYRKLILEMLKKDYNLKEYKKGKDIENEKNKYVLIIDEINRGDISKIFGEAFTLIESDKRKSEFKIKTQYQNLVPASDEFGEGFYIPSNLYIIGTMNDIDRSVESIDFAMRRRFSWVNIDPSDTQEEMWKGKSWAYKASERLENLNNFISELDVLGEKYLIGPSYFLNLKGESEEDFKNLWLNHIHPLLSEYLRGSDNKTELLDKMEKAYNNQLDEEVDETDND